jgi:hypothetical protein
MKNVVKGMFANYASPYPYMVRNGWEDVADYGVSRQTLENILRSRYAQGLSSLLNNIDYNKYPWLYNKLNQAYGQNNLDMIHNEMMYNPNLYAQMGD